MAGSHIHTCMEDAAQATFKRTYNPTSIDRYHNYLEEKQKFDKYRTAQRDQTIQTGLSVASGLAAFNPALVPVAAGLGVGYGLYKLGSTFGLY